MFDDDGGLCVGMAISRECRREIDTNGNRKVSR
jgi:hypothetical protein